MIEQNGVEDSLNSNINTQDNDSENEYKEEKEKISEVIYKRIKYNAIMNCLFILV